MEILPFLYCVYRDAVSPSDELDGARRGKLKRAPFAVEYRQKAFLERSAYKRGSINMFMRGHIRERQFASTIL